MCLKKPPEATQGLLPSDAAVQRNDCPDSTPEYLKLSDLISDPASPWFPAARLLPAPSLDFLLFPLSCPSLNTRSLPEPDALPKTEAIPETTQKEKRLLSPESCCFCRMPTEQTVLPMNIRQFQSFHYFRFPSFFNDVRR